MSFSLLAFSPCLCDCQNTLTFPLHPIDQVHLGLRVFPASTCLFHTCLYTTVVPQDQRCPKTCCKERSIFKKKKKAQTRDGEWRTNLGSRFKHRRSSFGPIFTVYSSAAGQMEREATWPCGCRVHSRCLNLLCASPPRMTALKRHWLSPRLAWQTLQGRSENETSYSGHVLVGLYCHQKATYFPSFFKGSFQSHCFWFKELIGKYCNSSKLFKHKYAAMWSPHCGDQVHPGIQGQRSCWLIPKATYWVLRSRAWGFLLFSCLYFHPSFSANIFCRNSISYNKKPLAISVRKGVFVIRTISMISIWRIKNQQLNNPKRKMKRKLIKFLKGKMELKSSKFKQREVLMALAFKNSY